jgi:hypothetical protein
MYIHMSKKYTYYILFLYIIVYVTYDSEITYRVSQKYVLDCT